ncbi:MAG: prephenate dehydrogenase/arogenate dehydrogenase family protein [Acidobacteriia bacterium]|nr:prephenate dehydrogenase/arogenate dehydrogenase family protein [Terriglobia bacterium]
MNTVSIVGVGLIGASFGLALRKAGFGGEIIGVSSESAIAAGLRSGAISSSATIAQAAERSDLIYLAQPIDRILGTIQQLASVTVPARCLITDAGSTKAAIVQKAAEFLPPGRFLGGHPMTGKELSGAEAADANLFSGRIYVLTPGTPLLPVTHEFRAWLRKFGANPVEMSPIKHDAIVAYTSHLPQLLSTALAATLARQTDPATSLIFGAGLLDMTRLALSSPEIWRSIIETNKRPIDAALDDIIETLVKLKHELEAGDPVRFFPAAAKFAAVIRTASTE